MTPHPIHTAMVLAAGLGTRMRPLTQDRPKPLVRVGGKTLIDRVLDDLATAGITAAVVNLHYKANMLTNHLADRTNPRVIHSDETETLLDTGGGVAAALSLFDDDVFIVTNSDALWGQGLVPAITALAQSWNNETMDSLLLLAPMSRAFGFEGAGDFYINDNGTPQRRGTREHAPTVYGGTQLVHRRIFDDCPDGAFSFNILWDRALDCGRLKAVLHNDDWYHVGTPDAVEPTGAALALTTASHLAP